MSSNTAYFICMLDLKVYFEGRHHLNIKAVVRTFESFHEADYFRNKTEIFSNVRVSCVKQHHPNINLMIKCLLTIPEFCS